MTEAGLRTIGFKFIQLGRIQLYDHDFSALTVPNLGLGRRRAPRQGLSNWLPTTDWNQCLINVLQTEAGTRLEEKNENGPADGCDSDAESVGAFQCIVIG